MLAGHILSMAGFSTFAALLPHIGIIHFDEKHWEQAGFDPLAARNQAIGPQSMGRCPTFTRITVSFST